MSNVKVVRILRRNNSSSNDLTSPTMSSTPRASSSPCAAFPQQKTATISFASKLTQDTVQKKKSKKQKPLPVLAPRPDLDLAAQRKAVKEEATAKRDHQLHVDCILNTTQLMSAAARGKVLVSLLVTARQYQFAHPDTFQSEMNLTDDKTFASLRSDVLILMDQDAARRNVSKYFEHTNNEISKFRLWSV